MQLNKIYQVSPPISQSSSSPIKDKKNKFTIIDWKLFLSPCLSWMSLSGLYSENQKGFGYNSKLVYRSLYFSYVVVIECWSFYFTWLNVDQLVAENFTTDKNSSIAIKWNFLIEQFNLFLFFVLGSFLSMILNGPKQWTSLLESLEIFQSLPNNKFYSALSLLPAAGNRIRNISVGAVVYVIISVIIRYTWVKLQNVAICFFINIPKIMKILNV